ncbi:GIY-YIG nuclease family protein, partial [Acinetobacter baumannii]|nr:GIY-YIG nuclease family protein [Acinetobacter baumannii]
LISKSQELEGKYNVYVGETVNGIQRMQHHDYNKDFWDTVILVQCKDTTLTKTHCAYLEYQVYKFIKEKTLYQIENKQELKNYAGRLSDADISDMDTFLDNLGFVLPALGVNLLTPVVKTSSQLNSQFAPTIDEGIEAEFFVLSRDKKVDGKAYIKDGVFYVRQGSIGKEQQTSSQHNFIINQRQSLIDKNMIRVIDDKIEFTQDVSFTSTSTPAAMLFGRPTSGPSTWKLLGQPQISYKDWEENQIMQ